MNKSAKNVIKAVSFTAMLASILVCLDVFVFVPFPFKDTSYKRFYEEERDSLDLVVVGNSTVRCGFSPMAAWEEFGITSYCLNSSPTHLETVKIMIDEIERTQKPEMIYIDLYGLTFQTKENAPRYVHEYVVDMPNGPEKDALYKKYPYLTEWDDHGLFAYHNEYRDPDNFHSIIHPKMHYMKGYAPQYAKYHETSLLPTSDPLPLSAEQIQYLQEIIDACRNYPETVFIFGKTPRYLIQEADLNDYRLLQSAKVILNNQGYQFFDYSDYLGEIGLTVEDQIDRFHLNHSGAKKWTHYFCEWANEAHNIGATQKKSSTKKAFDECLTKYKAEVNE